MSGDFSLNERGTPTRYQRDLVARDICPRCREPLDTGWECLKCGYDAKWIADETTKSIPQKDATRRAPKGGTGT